MVIAACQLNLELGVLWGRTLEGQVGARALCWILEVWYQLSALTGKAFRCCLPSHTQPLGTGSLEVEPSLV